MIPPPRLAGVQTWPDFWWGVAGSLFLAAPFVLWWIR